MSSKTNNQEISDQDLAPVYKFFSRGNYKEALSLLDNLIQNFPNNGTIKNKIYSPLKLWVWVVCAMWTGLPAIHMTRLNITDTAKNLVCTFIYTILYKKLVWFLKKEGNISNSLQWLWCQLTPFCSLSNPYILKGLKSNNVQLSIKTFNSNFRTGFFCHIKKIFTCFIKVM